MTVFPIVKNWLIAHKIPLIFIILVWTAFFSRILFGGQVFFLDDLKIIYYPLEQEYAQALSEWRLPQWSNAFGFGHPLIGWGQLGFFTPLHFLLRLLSVHPLTILQVSIMAYWLVGMVGMYLFFRTRSFSQSVASFTAVVYTLSGFAIGHLNHVNFYTSTMLLPWLLLCIHRVITRPTILSAAALTLVAAATTVSGQPQVVLYVFTIGAIFGISALIQHFTENRNRKILIKTVLFTLLAAVLTVGMASFALLPLFEFLPQTERADALPQSELFEFSYPPYHAITLILPYFFGDHENYWGAKGFQELAAFVGIIPLLFAGAALSYWKQYRAERITGITLVILGCVLALAKYSPVYRFLVEEHYITSIGVPGRFVYFFTTGIVFLGAAGFADLFFNTARSVRSRIVSVVTAVIAVVGIFTRFVVYVMQTPTILDRVAYFNTPIRIEWWLVMFGIIIWGAFVHLSQQRRSLPYVSWILVALSAITLVVYSWDYNPLTPRSQAYTPSPFIDTLKQYEAEHGFPARLYSSESIPIQGNSSLTVRLTDPIGPSFTVFQPLTVSRDDLTCLTIPLHAEGTSDSRIFVQLREGFSGTIFHTEVIAAEDLLQRPDKEICFPPIKESDSANLVLAFSSAEQTNIRLFSVPTFDPNEFVYFVRVQEPSQDQLNRSKKELKIVYEPHFPKVTDIENALLARHLHVLSGSSSARWIGALSIRPYRAFIETFFANDSEAIDGDNIHALTRYRTIVNMAGITHFAQALDYAEAANDPMPASGYIIVDEADTGDQIIRLYENPNAYPKAFLSARAIFKPAADETRHALRDPAYDPDELVYVNADTPPTLPTGNASTLSYDAKITHYSEERVEVSVTTNQDAVLVLTDSSTKQWRTYIDGNEAPRLVANSFFKSAMVPQGSHTITFVYDSPAVRMSSIVSGISLLALLSLTGYGLWQVRYKRNG